MSDGQWLVGFNCAFKFICRNACDANNLRSLITGTTGLLASVRATNSDVPQDYINTLWEALDGNRSIDLSGTTRNGANMLWGEIFQTFNTQKNQSYKVSFDLSWNPGSDPIKKIMNVTVDTFSGVFEYDLDKYKPSLVLFQSYGIDRDNQISE